jgi:hypothetical protein
MKINNLDAIEHLNPFLKAINHSHLPCWVTRQNVCTFYEKSGFRGQGDATQMVLT